MFIWSWLSTHESHEIFHSSPVLKSKKFLLESVSSPISIQSISPKLVQIRLHAEAERETGSSRKPQSDAAKTDPVTGDGREPSQSVTYRQRPVSRPLMLRSMLVSCAKCVSTHGATIGISMLEKWKGRDSSTGPPQRETRAQAFWYEV